MAGAKARLRFPSDGKVHALCAGGYDELCRRALLTLAQQGKRGAEAAGAGNEDFAGARRRREDRGRLCGERQGKGGGRRGWGQAARNSSGRGEGHGDSNGRAGAGDRLCQV